MVAVLVGNGLQEVPMPDLSQYAKISDIPPSSFVTPNIITMAQMLATYPASAEYRGKFCRTSDMWGIIDGLFRCTYNGRIYFWEPTTTPKYPGGMTLTGNATIQPMITPPIIEFGGALPALTTWTVTLGTDNLVPGVEKEFRGGLSSLLGTLNIGGSGLVSVVNLLLNANRRFVSYDNGSAVVWRSLQ